MALSGTDYEKIGGNYARHRRADPRIAAKIHAALGEAGSVLNVGAGAGSYEPEDRWVLAVEPSATMRTQRPPGAAPAIDAHAEALPLDDDSVDAAMACVTIHHWQPPEAGLAEMRRVARGPVVVFTFELEFLPAWQLDFLREGVALEQPRFPAIDEVAAALGGRTRVERIPTPADCADGFFEAFWARPEALLDPAIRASQSCWIAARRSGWSAGSRPPWSPAPGTQSTATCASRRASTAPCASGSQSPEFVFSVGRRAQNTNSASGGVMSVGRRGRASGGRCRGRAG